jgi:DNA modification methylase
MVKIEDLRPHPKNPNKHGDEQIALLAKNIRHLGWRHPILVSAMSGYIVAGHARLEAAKLLNLAAVPVDAQPFASEADELAYLLADNRIAELADLQTAALKDLLEELDTGGFDMDLTGFVESERERLMLQEHQDGDADAEPQIDRAEELRGKWGVETGDLWLIGDHRMLCGNGTQREDVSRLIEQGRAEMMLTDPPYGVAYHSNKKGAKSASIEGDLTQAAIPLGFAVAAEVALDENARVYLFGGTANWPMYSSLFDHFLRMQPRPMIWVKEGFVLHPTHYHSQFEIAFFGWKGKGGGPSFWYGDRKQSDVWDVRRDNNADRVHPTQKPVALFAIPIERSARPGGIVYDPFLGSGTTMVAAQNLGRKCYGLEIAPGYVAVILERMATAFPELDIHKVE